MTTDSLLGCLENEGNLKVHLRREIFLTWEPWSHLRLGYQVDL